MRSWATAIVNLRTGFTTWRGRLDPLVGRRLIHVAEVQRQPNGNWNVERFELIGEKAKRIEPLSLPSGSADRLPCPDRVYVQSPDGNLPVSRCLYPLMVFDS